MEVFKYLFQIYNNKQALVRQISLFSLVGLMVICFSNFASSFVNILFDNFYINPPSSRIVIRLCLALAVLILIYLAGYIFKMIGCIKSVEKFRLPDFNLEPFVVFIKMIPLMLIWVFYYLIMFFAGSCIVHTFGSVSANYIFYSLMICLLPFIFIIWAKFACDFEYRFRYFCFSYFVNVIDKSLGRVILLSIEIFILALAILAFIYFAFSHASNIKAEVWLFGVRYFIICLSAYLFVILQYTYLAGLAGIAKRTIPE